MNNTPPEKNPPIEATKDYLTKPTALALAIGTLVSSIELHTHAQEAGYSFIEAVNQQPTLAFAAFTTAILATLLGLHDAS